MMCITSAQCGRVGSSLLSSIAFLSQWASAAAAVKTSSPHYTGQLQHLCIAHYVVNSVSLPFALYRASCLWQLLLKKLWWRWWWWRWRTLADALEQSRVTDATCPVTAVSRRHRRRVRRPASAKLVARLATSVFQLPRATFQHVYDDDDNGYYYYCCRCRCYYLKLTD